MSMKNLKSFLAIYCMLLDTQQFALIYFKMRAFLMGKYSALIFACLKTPYNKPFNWEFVKVNLAAFLY